MEGDFDLRGFLAEQDAKYKDEAAFVEYAKPFVLAKLKHKTRCLKAVRQFARVHGLQIISQNSIVIAAAAACAKQDITPKCGADGAPLDLYNELYAMGVSGRSVTMAVVRPNYTVDELKILLLELWLKWYDKGNQALSASTPEPGTADRPRARATNMGKGNAGLAGQPSGSLGSKAPPWARCEARVPPAPAPEVPAQKRSTAEPTLTSGPFALAEAQQLMAVVGGLLGYPGGYGSDIIAAGACGARSTSSFNVKWTRPVGESNVPRGPGATMEWLAGVEHSDDVLRTDEDIGMDRVYHLVVSADLSRSQGIDLALRVVGGCKVRAAGEGADLDAAVVGGQEACCSFGSEPVIAAILRCCVPLGQTPSELMSSRSGSACLWHVLEHDATLLGELCPKPALQAALEVLQQCDAGAGHGAAVARFAAIGLPNNESTIKYVPTEAGANAQDLPARPAAATAAAAPAAEETVGSLRSQLAAANRQLESLKRVATEQWGVDAEDVELASHDGDAIDDASYGGDMDHGDT
jgi:hypothetical protein